MTTFGCPKVVVTQMYMSRDTNAYMWVLQLGFDNQVYTPMYSSERNILVWFDVRKCGVDREIWSVHGLTQIRLQLWMHDAIDNVHASKCSNHIA